MAELSYLYLVIVYIEKTPAEIQEDRENGTSIVGKSRRDSIFVDVIGNLYHLKISSRAAIANYGISAT